MEDYQLRVKNEHDELRDKTLKLKAFLDGSKIQSVKKDEQRRLYRQLQYMQLF